MLLQSVLLSLIIHLAFVTTYCLHLVFCVCRCGLEKRSNFEATLICIHKCHRLLQVACHYLLSHIVSPEKKIFLNHSKFGEADGRFLPLTLLFFISPNYADHRKEWWGLSVERILESNAEKQMSVGDNWCVKPFTSQRGKSVKKYSYWTCVME